VAVVLQTVVLVSRVKVSLVEMALVALVAVVAVLARSAGMVQRGRRVVPEGRVAVVQSLAAQSLVAVALVVERTTEQRARVEPEVAVLEQQTTQQASLVG